MSTGAKFVPSPAPLDQKDLGRYLENELRRVSSALDWLWTENPPVLSYSTTATGNSGSSETELYAYSVPGKTLRKNGETIEFWFSGTMVAHATATRQIRIKFGATTIFDSTPKATTTSYDFSVRGLIMRVSATSQKCITVMDTTQELFLITDYATTTETLSGAVSLRITGEAAGAGAATNDITFQMGRVLWRPTGG